MFVIPGIVALLTFELWRLNEVFEGLRWFSVPFVMGLAIFGYVLDFGVGVNRPRGSAMLLLLGGLFLFAVGTTTARVPDTLTLQILVLGVDLAAFIVVSEGIQTLRSLAAVSAILLVFTMALSLASIYQGLSPQVCYVAGAGPGGNDLADGRSCTVIADCLKGGTYDHDYLCEHPGLFGSHSIGGRVRFKGILEDPNELAWAICVGMPLALALYQLRRTWFRRILVLVAMGAGCLCVIMTQSRSGQLAVAGVFGVYFVRRFGWRGVVVGALVSLPVLLLGGRSDQSSSEERLECWGEAISMWRGNPLSGVGVLQFTEHHYLTAHNSFLLTLAELGPVGILLWSSALYAAFKITIEVQRDLATEGEAISARIFASALLASLAGTAISAFFLSIAYRVVLWILLGLVGGLYASVRAHDPTFRVRFGWSDLALVFGGDVVLIGTIMIYLKVKGV